jgi:predicted ATPase/DNA-binding SARP family transcriptional activator
MEPSRELHIQLLGEFRVWTEAQKITKTKWPRKAASLIKLLALAPGHRLHRERVLDHLWPELSTKAAMNNLHGMLHETRQSFSSTTHLRFQDHALLLGERVWVDVDAFIALAAKARRTREPSDYLAALELYKGDLLPEDPYEDWTSARREELRSLYLDLLMELARLQEERKDYPAALETLGKVLESEPALEAAHHSQMRLYLLLGQRRKAIKQYERLREALRQELDVEPDEESQALFVKILAETHEKAKPVALPPTNVAPALTGFIGREHELAELEPLLDTTRLLTLRGAPGCGKSRLALELAVRKRQAYPDGIFLADLGECPDAACLPKAVAQALALEGTIALSGLKAALADKELLLILDNCGHLVDACARLPDILLKHCPRLHILATSREALNLPGEVVWQVSPLAVPEEEGLLEDAEAARLFLERARLHRPDFSLTPERAPAILKICRKLAGLPLAIELAAAKLGVLSVNQIAARLDDLSLLRRKNPLASARHWSFEGALDASFASLSEEERVLFTRLAVFPGSFSLEEAEALYELDGLELLAELVNKSLVSVERQEEEPRYRLLVPLRRYALKGLGEEELKSLREMLKGIQPD